MIFQHSVSGVISSAALSFCRLAISAARFLVLFDHFRVCKIYCSSTCHRDFH